MALFFKDQKDSPRLAIKDFLKYFGPGFIVTVGFIDPGNWAANLAAGSQFGYILLWMVTLSTVMLILLQHNAAHLGIATGLCLSEAATKHFSKKVSVLVLFSAMLANISTLFAEILGAAIGLQMIFHLPLIIGSLLTAAAVCLMIFFNKYHRLERYIVAFVSLIGLSFIFELTLSSHDWPVCFKGWVVPQIPVGALPIVMSVLGAVVMPHNIFLHSEVIQSRQWHIKEEKTIRKLLRFEFLDTLLAMGVGWAINSSMIILAASVFYKHGMVVDDLAQGKILLEPLLGKSAALIFAFALLLAGFASSITACMAGGSVFAGIYGEPYDPTDRHSRTGILISLAGALIAIFFLTNPFQGLVWSQIILSIQLPITIVTLTLLTSSRRVMGKFVNSKTDLVLLWFVGLIVIGLNIALLINFFR
jgi:manganese transport protein